MKCGKKKKTKNRMNDKRTRECVKEKKMNLFAFCKVTEWYEPWQSCYFDVMLFIYLFTSFVQALDRIGIDLMTVHIHAILISGVETGRRWVSEANDKQNVAVIIICFSDK